MSDAFGKYKVAIPQLNLYEFEKNDMEKIITFHVGKIVPRVLKELDVYIDKKSQFTTKQTSLLLKGNQAKRENYKMKNYIDDYIEFYSETEFEILRAVEDILEEVIQDMLTYDKNPLRKEKFFNTLESVTGQTFVFVLSVICIGERLINRNGEIRNGRYLEHVLKAKKILSGEIKSIYKALNRGEIELGEANLEFRSLIENKVQDLIKFDSEIYADIKFEEDLHRMCTEESLSEFIYTNVESVRTKITRAPRLIGLFDF